MSYSRPPRLVALFIVLAILQIVPVWSVKYVPTGDGPSHVYNAWVMHALLTGEAPANIEAAYRIDWRPHPNWTGHAFMALVMFVVPPLVAEKLLLTLIVALLLAGTWVLVTAVDPRNEMYAFLAFAFVYPQTFVAGYYNYSLSIGLFLLILGIWWCNRERPTAPNVAILAALLVLCYFTHPLATLLACGAIGLLSVVARRPAHVIALLPAGMLLLVFGRTAESGVGEPLRLSVDWTAAAMLTRLEFLYAFDHRQRPFVVATSLIYLALIVITLVRERRRRPPNGLLLVAALFALSMFWLPAPAGTRALFTQRMAPFVFLTLAAWFTPQLTRWWRAALLSTLSIIAVANAAFHLERFRHFGGQLTEFVRAFDAVEPEATLLPLFFSRPYSASFVPLFTHAVGYVALEKRLVHLGNYEPGSHYFPVADRVVTVDARAVEIAPESIDVAHVAPHSEYIAAISLRDESRQRRDLQQRYRLVAEQGDLRLYRRRDPLTEPHDLILLPLLGRRSVTAARWRVDQTIANRGPEAVRVLFRDCLGDMPCELALAAGQTRPIATDQSKAGLLLVPRTAVKSIDILTVVRRIDVDRPELSIRVPAVHEASFKRGELQIRGIDTRHRIGLRAYLFTERPWEEVTLRLTASATGAVIGERKFYMAAYTMHENANLDTDFPGFAARADSVDIDLIVPPHARVWAFATALNEAEHARVHLPEASR